MNNPPVSHHSTVARILIADDQPDVLEALRLLLKGEGYQIDTADSPARVLKALEKRDYDVLLIDLPPGSDRLPTQVPRGMSLRELRGDLRRASFLPVAPSQASWRG